MKNKENKLIRTGKALTLLIVLATVAAMAAAEVIYETSGTSRFILSRDSGVRKVTTVSQDYLLYQNFLKDGDVQMYLVNNQRTRSYFLDAEGVEGGNSWSVRSGPKLGKVVWSKSENSTLLNLNEDHGFVITGLEGCCGSMTGYRAYEIETGRILMSFNDYSGEQGVVQPFTLEVPNSVLRVRLVGLIGSDTTRDADFVAPASGYGNAAILKYGNPYLRQKLQVDIQVAPTYAPSILDVKLEKDPSVPNSGRIEFNGKRVTLWNVDGTGNANDIAGVILEVSIDAGYGTKVIQIPIRQDRLDLEKAVIPQGVQIRSIAI